MAIFDGILLMSDVDGTLLSGTSQMSPFNVEKINYFVKNGGLFSLATGRCVDACRELLSDLGISLSAPAATVNGTVIYDYETEKVVASTGIDDYTKNIIVELSKIDNPLLGIEIHSREKVIDARINHKIEIHNLYENLHPLEMTCEQALGYEWNKLLFAFEDGYTREMLREDLIAMGVSPDQIIFTNAYLGDGVHDYLEVNPEGADKGTGVRMLADELGVDMKNVYAIGDFNNDVPMLKVVGHPAVVGGAPQHIKDLAEFVSCDAADGAVGRFIDYIEERIKSDEH